MHDIEVTVTYNIKDGAFEVTGNAKNPKGIIDNFLRIQMGAGVDNTPANRVDIYNISIYLDLSEDIFTSTHNCGNKGLRDGILMEVSRRL